MPKGFHFGKKIEYEKAPRKITIDNNNRACMCENCGGVGQVYKIYYNDTNYADDTGNIRKNMYAKEMELWLCEECMQELIDAIKSARGVDYL